MKNTWDLSHVKYIGGSQVHNMKEKSCEMHRREVMANTWEGHHVKYIGGTS